MAVFEAGVELVHTDAGGPYVGVVTGHAVLLEERFHDLLERGLERLAGGFRRLGAEVKRG
jgi:hypothetical protein